MKPREITKIKGGSSILRVFPNHLPVVQPHGQLFWLTFLKNLDKRNKTKPNISTGFKVLRIRGRKLHFHPTTKSDV